MSYCECLERLGLGGSNDSRLGGGFTRSYVKGGEVNQNQLLRLEAGCTGPRLRRRLNNPCVFWGFNRHKVCEGWLVGVAVWAGVRDDETGEHLGLLSASR